MRTQFAVWDCDFEQKGLHPAVLISHPDRCAGARWINVLFCTSQRQGREPYPVEVVLDTADGMDWESFCGCSVLWAVDVKRLKRYRGRVTLERRQAIRQKIRDLFLLMDTD